MRFLNSVRYYYTHFGLKTSISLIVLPRILSKVGFKWNRVYIPNLLKWQKAFIAPILSKYQTMQDGKSLNSDYIIWTCWWQGESKMPEVIQQCYKSLIRNSNGHKVILITKDNWHEYLTLPELLITKLNNGLISLSHFSDIIRLSLLKKYGGAWVDAAVFLIRPFRPATDFFMPRMVDENNTINQGKWWFGVMKGSKGDIIFSFMLDCLLSYWEKYNAPVDYLMFDGFLRIAYEEIPLIKQKIDKLKISSPELHLSRYLFDKEVDNEQFEHLLSNNDFLSLTWRKTYPLTTSSGIPTYYGELIRRFSDSK